MNLPVKPKKEDSEVQDKSWPCRVCGHPVSKDPKGARLSDGSFIPPICILCKSENLHES